MSRTVAKIEPASVSERQSGVDRVVDILEELLRSRAPVRVGELARRLGAPRSTLYNLVNRLVAAKPHVPSTSARMPTPIESVSDVLTICCSRVTTALFR